MIIALYDVSGIQEYIFQSSRMRENIGASSIVGRVLKEQLPQVLNELKEEQERNVVLDWEQQKTFAFTTDSTVDIEIVYNGGGNAMVAFRNVEDFHTVNEMLSLRLLQVSYSLHLAIAAVESDGVNFVADKKRLDQRLTEVKARMLRPRPIGAFPFSEQEARSGLPITSYDQHTGHNVSTMQKLKLSQGHQDVKDSKNSASNRWAVEMEDLVRQREEDSYVAVVHIDGNGMGKQIRSRMEQWEASYSYAEAVCAMRALSSSITARFRDTFEELIAELIDSLPADHWVASREKLPIRPLILDGDDLTFVCLGEWGLPLAAKLLEKLHMETSQSGKSEEVSMSACAGVAFVHSHYPFNLAYEISEDCCKSAKQARLEAGEEHGSYIAFEVVRGSQLDKEAGKRQSYRVGQGQMGDRDYAKLDQYMRQITVTNWPRWRLEKLYEAIKGQPELLQLYVKECESRGYSLRSLGVDKDEEINTRPTSLLDALELQGMFDIEVFASALKQREGERT